MRVLVGCEFSGVVREAFVRLGHDAWSCDFLPSEQMGQHIQGDIRELDVASFDLLVAFPPCTYLCSSGARWWKDRQQEQADAIEFVRWLLNAPCRQIAIENPIGILSTCVRRPDQIIQPWWFGHPETKAMCLWLKSLPLLKPTQVVGGREPRAHHEPPRPDRWKRRSRMLVGIAEAMAAQWGSTTGGA